MTDQKTTFKPGVHRCRDCVFFRLGYEDKFDRKIGDCLVRPPTYNQDSKTGGARPGTFDDAFCGEGRLP